MKGAHNNFILTLSKFVPPVELEIKTIRPAISSLSYK